MTYVKHLIVNKNVSYLKNYVSKKNCVYVTFAARTQLQYHDPDPGGVSLYQSTQWECCRSAFIIIASQAGEPN